jgi:hypothetical protein
MATFVTLASIQLAPQAACPGIGVNSKTTGWQYTMSNVRKWDGQGTFAGSRGNDEVAPISGHSQSHQVARFDAQSDHWGQSRSLLAQERRNFLASTRHDSRPT